VFHLSVAMRIVQCLEAVRQCMCDGTWMRQKSSDGQIQKQEETDSQKDL